MKNMNTPYTFWTYICYCIFFPPIFSFLFVLGIIKGAIFSPWVFLVIAFGDAGVVVGLWPLHLFWSIHCLIRTNKFGLYMKILLICLVPIPIAIWTILGVGGSAIMGIGYGFVWPVMETFRAISKKDVPLHVRLRKCFTDGTWTQVQGACTIVRDFADFSFHTYFSFMDSLLDSKEEKPIELKVLQLPGCLLVAILGIVVNIPLISLISLYKGPILLFKGWHQLIRDLIGREGPFLETVCVPFAGLWIFLWPFVVLFAIIAGILSSIPIGCYSAVVAYQESSTVRGLKFVVAAASVYDEYTNDLLYLREGSCFPRSEGLRIYTWIFVYYVFFIASLSLLALCIHSTNSNRTQMNRNHLTMCEVCICFLFYVINWQLSSLTHVIISFMKWRPQYRERADSAASLLSALRLRQHMESVYADEPLINSSANVQKLTASVIWDEIFRACESIGKEMLNIGAIHTDDIDGWKKSKNKIINIGLPAYAFLDCFLRSIKNESTGFLLRNNVEITSVNRPEGRILDWLYEPMSVMKKQIKNLNLQESEELYFYKLCLYGGDMTRVEYWQNGGIAPQDEIRRAQLEGISRRLRGFCLTISRLPTSHRRFDEVVKAIEQSKHTEGYGVADNDIEASGSRS